jgi:peptidoglycan/xylan/chitin deacetylase (PgdA/CDA1 family)
MPDRSALLPNRRFFGPGMRKARAGFLLVTLVAASTTPLCSGLAFAQQLPTQAVASQPVPEADAPQSAQEPADQAAANCPGHPDALGTSRVLAIDPAQYRRIGHMQYSDSLPLADKEVVLTFDDGPILPYSNQILDILASQCVKATYFLVGEMARAFAATVRRIYEEGHTIGTHSEHHPTRFGQLPIERMRHEIDRGISDVSAALGDPKYLAPFFRIPGLARSRLVESELAARELSVFSSDTDADDWHHRISGQQIIALAMRRLEGRGKGILLLHDIHPATVAALPGLLKALKDNGFHIVQVVPAAPYVIAMANKPKARSLASTLPGEAMIGDDGNRGAHPRWPHVVANVPSDDSMLPVPDVSAFEPDALTSEATVRWPAQAEAERAPPAKTQAPAPRKHKFAGRAEKRKQRIAHAGKDERRAEHAHRHKRTHTSANGQHKKRRNAANDTNLDDLAMSEVSPLPESDTEYVAC